MKREEGSYREKSASMSPLNNQNDKSKSQSAPLSPKILSKDNEEENDELKPH